MPVSFLSEAERRRFNSFPADLSTDDLIAFFTLGEQDLRQIHQLFFENDKKVKYLLSPTLTGIWKEGDRAIALNYRQSSYIVEKKKDVLLKDTPSAPYVDIFKRLI